MRSKTPSTESTFAYHGTCLISRTTSTSLITGTESIRALKTVSRSSLYRYSSLVFSTTTVSAFW